MTKNRCEDKGAKKAKLKENKKFNVSTKHKDNTKSKDKNKHQDENKHWAENEHQDKNNRQNDRINKKGNTICSLSESCGGCQLLNMSYEEQLKYKQNQVNGLLRGISELEPIIGMEKPYHYRNKVHAIFAIDGSNNIISGVYEAGSHIVIPVEKCYIEEEECDEIIGSIRKLAKSFKMPIYNEDAQTGLLRHVLIRKGFATGQVMVVLVLSNIVFPSKKNFVKELLKLHPNINTIVVNVNNRKTSMVLGDKEEVIYGKGYIEDVLCNKTFKISPKSFYQVNPVQTEILYNKALEFAELKGRETVIDAYCGIGTIGIIASKRVKRVIGIELNKDAVKDAISNAKINNIKNAHFYQGDATEFMMNMAAKNEKVDVVILDPPRSGSTEEFINAVSELSPKKVIYISCNPETLARDLRYFATKGYKAEKVLPVDMFPGTGHVETVVLLSQQKPNDKIEVDLDLDVLDVTSAELKATYAEIKDYVLKEHGLKVSNLYISQVKRKCGLEVGENYNLAKSEDAKQPSCPEEKEKSIVEALKSFGMI